MANEITTATVPSAVLKFYGGLLKRALPNLVYAKLGTKKPFASRSGKVIFFRRYNSFAVGSALSDDGASPGYTALTYTEVSANLVQYGALCMITDLTDLTSTDPIITEVMMILGEQMAYTRDKILAGVLVGTSSVFYAGGVATRSAIVTLPKPADFNKIKRAFDRAHAKPFTSAIYGSAKVSSQAIRPAFMAVVHPDTLFCLENPSDSDWAGKFVSFANYPQESQWDPAEVGSYGYFRFLLSDMAPIVPDSGGAASTTFKFTTSASALDVYQTLIFAKDAFSVCPMDKGTFEPIIVPPGGQADPLKRRTLVGWKLTTANIITNDLFMCNYEHAVSV